jgi:hypothetical protein
VCALQVRNLNSGLDAACPSLKARVDEADRAKSLVTRHASAGTPTPASSEEQVTAAAGRIVEESMAEAAALVHHLFDKQMAGKPELMNGGRGGGSVSGGAAKREDSGEGHAAAPNGMLNGEAGAIAPAAEAAGGAHSAARSSLFVDDELLMQMSTKLTAMFVAIQRCASRSLAMGYEHNI